MANFLIGLGIGILLTCLGFTAHTKLERRVMYPQKPSEQKDWHQVQMKKLRIGSGDYLVIVSPGGGIDGGIAK